MTPRFLFMLLAFVFMTCAAHTDSIRGMPYYVKLTSIQLKSMPRSPEKLVEVCYQFATTTPIFDYSDLASNVLNGVPVTLMPQPAYDAKPRYCHII